jgi:exopolysaccharide biosynthesis protein
MPNTANYSFPTPADTDLVKNGADAIRDLGDAVDTAMNTALGTKKAGLVLLNTTSFSAVSSQDITGIFSATYTQYRVICNIIGGTTSTELRGRFLSGTNTPYTGADHRMQTFSAKSSTLNGTRFTGDTQFYNICEVSSDNESLIVMEFLNPFQSVKKSILTSTAMEASTTGIGLRITAHGTPNTTAFTGFRFLPVASTIAGSVSVYGYNL